MSGKVHHRVHPAQSGPQFGGIGDVAHDQVETLRQEFMTGREIVVDDYFVPMVTQCSRRVAANVARSADDEDSHLFSRARTALDSIIPDGRDARRSISIFAARV